MQLAFREKYWMTLGKDRRKHKEAHQDMKTKYPSMFGVLAGLLLLLLLPVMAMTSSTVPVSAQNDVVIQEVNTANDITLVGLSASNFFVAPSTETGRLFTDLPALNTANISFTSAFLHLPAPTAIDMAALSAINFFTEPGFINEPLTADSADLKNVVATADFSGYAGTVLLASVTQGGVSEWRYVVTTDNVSNYLNTAVATGTISTYNYTLTIAAYAGTTTMLQISGIYSATTEPLPKPGNNLLLANNFCFCGGTFQTLSNIIA